VVVFSELKKSEYDSEASFSFLTLITFSDNSTRERGFAMALVTLSTIFYIGLSFSLIILRRVDTFPNVNPL